MRRSYDTIYSKNVSQAIIVSQVRYDVGASSLTNVTFRSKNCHSGCTKTRHFDIQNPNDSNNNNNNEWAGYLIIFYNEL